jgi:hypothetical protein
MLNGRGVVLLRLNEKQIMLFMEGGSTPLYDIQKELHFSVYLGNLAIFIINCKK